MSLNTSGLKLKKVFHGIILCEIHTKIGKHLDQTPSLYHN